MGKVNKRIIWHLRWISILSLTGLMIVVGGIAVMSWRLPSVKSLKTFRPPIATEVFSDDFVKIGEFYKERRIFLPLRQMPPLLIKGFIAAEDSNFFEHKGISFSGIFRATIKNLIAGQVRQGGSTITQQVAKALLLSPERSFIRKAKEAVLAYKMERFLSKEEILEIYLNQVYLGYSAYGVQAAAQSYFNKDVTELTLGEMAMLSGLTKAPSRDNPHKSVERAIGRKKYVLKRMVEESFISKEEAKKALEQEIRIQKDSNINMKFAPYFVEHVRRYLKG